MINPAATNRIGRGRFRLFSRAVRLIRMAMIKATILKFAIQAQCTQKPGRRADYKSVEYCSDNKKEVNFVVVVAGLIFY